MSKTKQSNLLFIPGPWKVDFRGGVSVDDSIVGGGFQVCEPYGHSHDERLANAALIAASPDILFALEQAYDYISDCFPSSSPDYTASPLSDDEYNLLKTIKEALAKAKGETNEQN